MPAIGFHRRKPPPLAFNLMPMVDMIFTLSMFFMLVTRFSSAELIPMQLPQPQDSRAETLGLPERVIINCLPADPESPDEGVRYSIGPNRAEPLSVIAERLILLKRQLPNVKAVVRADRRLPYADVRAVMRVIADSGIDMLNVVAHVEEGT